ncbi:MAG: hypothetical protein WA440_13605 [Ignavibacteriaceae bacterium]
MNKVKSLIIIILSLIILGQTFNYAQDSLEVSNQKAKEVIERYLTAIGGREALSNIEDRTTIMRGSAMGQSLTMIVKQKAPNKMRQEVKAGGMDQLVVFDGEKGIMKVAEQKIDIAGKELEQLKIEATLNILLDPESFGIKISFEGEENTGDVNMFKVKFILPSGIRWFEYFDAATGLKVKEEKELQTEMGIIQQTVNYDNYTEVDGIKYPFKITQSVAGQVIDVAVSSIKINKGLSDDLFVIAE